MSCKVYTGDASKSQTIKNVCSNFKMDIRTLRILRSSFWVRNPTTTKSWAVPVMFGNYRIDYDRNRCWSIAKAGIRVIPTSQTPIADNGNFASSSDFRQISNRHLDLTTRNSKNIKQGDFYILRLNFDLTNIWKQVPSNTTVNCLRQEMSSSWEILRQFYWEWMWLI